MIWEVYGAEGERRIRESREGMARARRDFPTSTPTPVEDEELLADLHPLGRAMDDPEAWKGVEELYTTYKTGGRRALLDAIRKKSFE